jgi:hypothetical protein
MRIRYCSLVLTAALSAPMQFNPAAASSSDSEVAARTIGAQLQRQGVACTAPRTPVRDDAASIPHETVWTLRCDEASYEVRLIPDRKALIKPISVGLTECRADQGNLRPLTDDGSVFDQRRTQ